MAYRIASTPAQLEDRMTALEGEFAVGLHGTHFYVGAFTPATLAAAGTDSAGVATQLWVGEVRIPCNTLLTGISFLIGSVGGTDKVIVALYDVNGNLVANSALAGATVGTASTFQRVAFTTPYQAAPGKYYIAVSTNGTTAKLQTQPGGDHDAGAITGQTFGTLPNPITVPTTFTASKAPIAMTY